MQSLIAQPRIPSSITSSIKAAMDTRRSSINYYFHPHLRPINKNATPDTTKMILDYLLEISIQSRLKQADLELDELSFFASGPDSINNANVDAAERKCRRIERAAKAEKDKSAVENMVTGVLSDHRTRLPPTDLPSNLQHRLYLAQLTNLVYSRFDALPSSTHAHHHLHSSSGRQKRSDINDQLTKQNEHMIPQDDKKWQQMFENPIEHRYCRRHRMLACSSCGIENEDTGVKRRKIENGSLTVGCSTTISNVVHPPPPGLIDAIIPFLKTSAMALRRELEEEKKETIPNQNASGVPVEIPKSSQKGGMPPEWYNLFLELLTQAAIEAYFCDGRSGLEPILEIFSYGDADESEDLSTYDSDEDEEDEYEEEVDDEQYLRAADHHLLFPKTGVTVKFAKRLREREKNFFTVNGTLEEHFQALATKYPLQEFEQGMRKYIDTIRKTMEIPVLTKQKNLHSDPNASAAYENGPGSPPISSSHPSSSGSVSPSSVHSISTVSSHQYSNTISRAKSPILPLVSTDGALLMPDVPSDYEDNDEDDDNVFDERQRRDSGNESAIEVVDSPSGTKRRRGD